MRKSLPAIAGFEDKERGPLTKECGWPLCAGKGQEIDSSPEPPEKSTALTVP